MGQRVSSTAQVTVGMTVESRTGWERPVPTENRWTCEKPRGGCCRKPPAPGGIAFFRRKEQGSETWKRTGVFSRVSFSVYYFFSENHCNNNISNKMKILKFLLWVIHRFPLTCKITGKINTRLKIDIQTILKHSRKPMKNHRQIDRSKNRRNRICSCRGGGLRPGGRNFSEASSSYRTLCGIKINSSLIDRSRRRSNVKKGLAPRVARANSINRCSRRGWNSFDLVKAPWTVNAASCSPFPFDLI